MAIVSATSDPKAADRSVILVDGDACAFRRQKREQVVCRCRGDRRSHRDCRWNPLRLQSPTRFERNPGDRTDRNDRDVTVADDLQAAPAKATVQLGINSRIPWRGGDTSAVACVMVPERTIACASSAGAMMATPGCTGVERDVLERMMRRTRGPVREAAADGDDADGAT